jgi:putative membrane protein
MEIIANSLIVLVILLHIYFLTLEMFLWTKPQGLKVFRQTKEQAQASAILAANQGLYNGFLAAGLIWSLLHPNPTVALQLKLFFLTCITIAGVYGGYTVNKRIFIVQSTPAMLAIILALMTQA